MVFATDLVTNVFHEFAEYLYGKNMQVRGRYCVFTSLKKDLNSGAAGLGAGQVLSGESQLRRPPGFFIISGHSEFEQHLQTRRLLEALKIDLQIKVG